MMNFISSVLLLSFAPRATADTSLRGKDQVDEERKLSNAWYPVYSSWEGGYCTDVKNPNFQPKTTELECCNAYFPNQTSGKYDLKIDPEITRFLTLD